MLAIDLVAGIIKGQIDVAAGGISAFAGQLILEEACAPLIFAGSLLRA